MPVIAVGSVFARGFAAQDVQFSCRVRGRRLWIRDEVMVVEVVRRVLITSTENDESFIVACRGRSMGLMLQLAGIKLCLSKRAVDQTVVALRHNSDND